MMSTAMVPPSDWLLGLEDVSQVDQRIQQLEQERQQAAALAKGYPTQETGDYDQRARDLASQLEMAIRSNDIETLNALALDFGDIQSVTAAKNLVQEKQRLSKAREQMVIYDQLRSELSKVTDYDYASLALIKERVNGVTDQRAQTQLFTTLDNIVHSCREEFTHNLIEELSKSHWTKAATIPESTSTAFTEIINLQSLLSTEPTYPEPLWAFATVADHFKVSFDYHFNSDRDTNRIDRPELFLTYLPKYLTSHIAQLNRSFTLSQTVFANRYAHSEFITAALIPVRLKLKQCINAFRESTQENTDEIDMRLLTHLIREVVSFDKSLVTEFYYDPMNNALWPGLFANFEYTDLEKWLNLEIKLSLQNLESIVNAPNVFQIDYTSVGDDELKPTVSAIKLKYLFESTTKTFQKFFTPNYDSNGALQKFKLKLFSKLYLKFLELYYERLNDGAIAFVDLFNKTKSVIQPVPNAEIDITGVNGLERLFRLYCSLKYVIQSLNVWNHELIFVELNNLYNQYANNKSISLFHSIMVDYNDLQKKVFKKVLEFYGKAMDNLLKGYGNLNTWNHYEAGATEMALSSELIPLIDVVSELFSFSERVLTSHDSAKIRNYVSFKIADYYLQYIIKTNHFSSTGVKQLELDYATLWQKLQLKRNFPDHCKLEEALLVLNLNDDQVPEFSNYSSLAQYARSGEFESLRKYLQLTHLRDGDLLDIMLRVH